MSSEFNNALFKLIVPLVVIAFCMLVSRLRRWPLQESLGMRRPDIRKFLLWIVAWIGWLAVSEWIGNMLGIGQATPWKQTELLAIVLRIAAIGIAGPVAEEFVFRGLLYFRLKNTRLKETGAVLVLAAIWAAIHYQYAWPDMVLIFLDGIILGFARKQTNSIVPSCVMHSMGNLFSIYQSLRG